MTQDAPKAFRYDEADGIGTVTFDLPDSKVNIFNRFVMEQLNDLLGELEQKTHLRGLIFASGKPGQFIAGADLNELSDAHMDHEKAVGLAQRGQELFSRASRLPYPTVAAIDGPTMGGGTEFVIALDQRLCGTNRRAEIALPEVSIGIIPGWGGTQRLPRLIGVANAIDVICSGKPVPARKAAELGLVFDVVPSEQLLDEARRLVKMMAAQNEGEPGASASGLPPALEPLDWRARRKRMQQPVGLSEDQSRFIFGVAEGKIRAETKGHYPAPLAALKAVREGCNRTLEDGLAIERELIAGLIGTEVSRNLIAVFFMTRRLDRDPGVADKSVKPRDIHRVGVVGAGLMGSGIATAHARRGLPVVMTDVSDDFLAAGMHRARKVVESRIKIGRAKPEDLADLLTQLTPSTSLETLRDRDLVIEAVTENKDLKMKVYRQLAEVLPEGCLLASNTSTISITEMAAAAPVPERFLGMHFFNPVDRMQLVEVIRGEKTSDEAVATAVALAKRIGKKPIVVKDCPGFLVNRILLPYMNEALLLLEEGAEPKAIDKAATDFGMPMGPITLYDLVGLDTALYAGRVVSDAFTDRAKPAKILDALVEAGRLGTKSGAGFFKYDPGSTRPKPDPELDRFLTASRGREPTEGTAPTKPSHDEITDRLFLPMLVEASLVLTEGIVRDPADVDMGLILGIGFPPFRGGILRWADSNGMAVILERLAKYEALGMRFQPTKQMKDFAQSKQTFYP